jgi:hypothetical protein
MSRNPIWDYFVKDESDLSKALCKCCSKPYSLGSTMPGKQTVHGLKSHLAKCHKDAYLEYSNKVADREQTVNPAKKAKLDDKQKKSLVTFFQPTIPVVQARRQIWPDNHPSTQRIDKCIMDLIIVDMLPYSLVEGEAFKRLNFGDPLDVYRYKLKSEKCFRSTLMPATYEKVAEHVKSLLAEAEWVSFTTDGWSNPTKSCSLLSFTGHFLRGAVRQKVILSAMVLDDDHTGLYLSSKLVEAISKWSLTGKIHLGIRDNAANMICAMEKAGVDDLGCLAHTMQLVLHDAVFTQSSVETSVEIRKVVTNFKHSEQANRHL